MDIRLGDFAKRLPDEEVLRITIAIREGSATETEKNKLIGNYVGLAISIALRMGRRYSLQQSSMDDITAEAAYVVVDIVNKSEVRLYDNNIGGYIVDAVKRRCKEYITKLRVVSMPVRTIRYKLATSKYKRHQRICDAIAMGEIKEAHGKVMELLPTEEQPNLLESAKTLTINNFKEEVKSIVFKSFPIPTIKTVLEDYPDIENYNNTDYAVPVSRPVIDPGLIEALKKSINSPMEEHIIKLRSEGYTYAEVAAMTGLGKSWVGMVVKKVEDQFDKYYSKKTK